VPDNYEVYSPDAADSGGPWVVAIEYSNQGDAKPPTVVRVGETHHPDRKDALAAAEKHAFEFQPPDPFSPQGRHVFRDGPDGFLVVIQGAMSTFHMSVRAVQYVGKA
jgi:hypothetical protein